MDDQFRIDSQKLIFHPHRVAQWLDGKDSWETAKEIYPLYVEISPVGACNHRCTFCAVSYIGYQSVRLDAHMLVDRLHEAGSLGIKSVMFAGEGEPLLHNGINQIVAAAHISAIDVSFTTNGTLLNKLDLENISWVKVSLNAGTRETYAQVHQTKEKDWDVVWRNLADAAQRRTDCTVGVQTLLLPENENEILLLAERCRDAGADYLVIKPYSQHKFSLDHTRQYEGIDYSKYGTLEESLKRLETDDFKVMFRSASMKSVNEPIPYSKCQATPFTWAYLMASGDLYGCSAYLLDDRFNYGNLNTLSFREVWQGEKRKANWDYVRNHLDIHECRQSCRMDKANRYLTDLVNGVPHQNFI
mgnify:CR=1 FL=1